MIVDAHAHLIEVDTESYPHASSSSTEAEMPSPSNIFTVDQLMDSIKTEGISHSIAVQRTGIYGSDNSYVVDAAFAHPDLLSAVVSVDATAPDAIDLLDYWVGERGAKGFPFTTSGSHTEDAAKDTSWFSSDQAKATWRRAEELGIPICIHFSRWNRDVGLETLSQLIDDFPEITLVIDHLGTAELKMAQLITAWHL